MLLRIKIQPLLFSHPLAKLRNSGCWAVCSRLPPHCQCREPSSYRLGPLLGEPGRGIPPRAAPAGNTPGPHQTPEAADRPYSTHSSHITVLREAEGGREDYLRHRILRGQPSRWQPTHQRNYSGRLPPALCLPGKQQCSSGRGQRGPWRLEKAPIHKASPQGPVTARSCPSARGGDRPISVVPGCPLRDESVRSQQQYWHITRPLMALSVVTQ